MQFIKRFRVGQRAIKTAISVGLALALAMVLGSSLPIFAAIGAISVMSRTWVDSLKESLNQIAGTFLGYLIACVFVTVLPNPTFFVWMALGGSLAWALSHAISVLVISCPCALG